MSEFLTGILLETFFEARLRRLISSGVQAERRSQLPARIARVDEALLPPVEHGDEKQQQDMLAIKLRDALVRARVSLINAVRFTLKSLGHPVANPASERFPPFSP